MLYDAYIHLQLLSVLDDLHVFQASDIEEVIKPALSENRVHSKVFSQSRTLSIGVKRVYMIAEMAAQVSVCVCVAWLW